MEKNYVTSQAPFDLEYQRAVIRSTVDFISDLAHLDLVNDTFAEDDCRTLFQCPGSTSNEYNKILTHI
jgi:hypothetical protein